jgi:hypothetical protein
MKLDEVRRKIQKCKKQHLIELDLSGILRSSNDKRMTAIPEEVFDCVWLKKLSLDANQLTNEEEKKMNVIIFL